MQEITPRVSLLAILGTFSLFTVSSCIPSTNHGALNSGLTILAYNDLDNNPATGSGAILLSKPNTFSSALESCALLGEALWSPTARNFKTGLNSSLSYQIYQDNFPTSQLFWTSEQKPNEKSCHAIDYKGKLSTTSCSSKLPALCTHKAPVSTFNTTDSSKPFQITHKVGRGSLTGYRDFYTWKFLGVRFAAQPQRYAYSTVFDSSSHALAINQGKDCPQPIGQVANGSTSEDCLNLNIWTTYLPPPSSHEKKGLKPVMVYIHGGGLLTGTPNNQNTDSTNLASRGDVVVVAIHYRLGQFGFLALKDGIHKGNYGISDMVTALEWVKKNIHDFGGDKDQVTIFGESAGGVSVRALLASKPAKGLFARAIMQSTPAGWELVKGFSFYQTIEQHYSTYANNILSKTGCGNSTEVNQVACLRAIDVTALGTDSAEFAPFPSIDGRYLKSNQLALNNTSGYTSNVPIMFGLDRNEAGIILPVPPAGIDLSTWLDIMSPIVHYDLAQALTSGLFNVPTNPTNRDIFSITERLVTDGAFQCHSNALLYSASKHKAFPKVYGFQFNRTHSPTGYSNEYCDAPKTPEHPNGDPELDYAKCHGSEQLIMFGNLRRELPDRDGKDVGYIQTVVDAWSAFARTGDPNPEKKYLAARGYGHTLRQNEKAGKWEPVNWQKPGWRILQSDSKNMLLPEQEQCAYLGIPLDYYEKN